MAKNNPTGGQALFDFLKARTIVDANGCWIWQCGYHSNNPPCGQHGMLTIAGRKVQAHRAMWTAARGDIPGELCVLHRCDVPKCINPDHLFLGTRLDNNADAVAKGRHAGAKQRAKTHCLRGHEFTPENTACSVRGTRSCITCRSERGKQNFQRKHGFATRFSGVSAIQGIDPSRERKYVHLWVPADDGTLVSLCGKGQISKERLGSALDGKRRCRWCSRADAWGQS